MPEEITGEEVVPAAGEEEKETDYSALFEDETVEETPKETEEKEETEENKETPKEEDKVEIAFAKRLSQEKEKLERKLREELEEEYKAKAPQPMQTYQPQNLQQPTKEMIEKLAEDLGTTSEAAMIYYNQQLTLNQQQTLIKTLEEKLDNLSENSTKSEVKEEIDKRRKGNPLMPEWDDAAINKIRDDHRRKYGTSLPWEDAYDKYFARQMASGDIVERITREVEQKVVGNIANRTKKTVPAGTGAKPKLPSIEDMPADEFAKLKEAALAGKLKKS